MLLTGRAALGTLVLLATLGAVGVAVANWSTDRSTRPPESRKAVTADPSGHSELLKAVTPKGILEHEHRFQAIADAHGDTGRRACTATASRGSTSRRGSGEQATM